ncbi:ABC transporter ATP-binding protein [Streptomyces atratus]|uniref:ABC transporter ATP-binding protein n=1 Tax=Streptomyces atratus TaxID=1893 RepID=UPI0036687781
MTHSPAPPLSVRQTWRALYSYIRPHRAAIATGGLLTLTGSAAALAQPLAAKALVDALAADRPYTTVLITLTALVITGAVIQGSGQYLLERTAESVVLTARQRLTTRLLRLRIPEADRTEPGDLLSRVTSDTTLLRQVSTHSLVSGFTGAATLIAAIVLMGALDLVLLGVALGVIALSTAATTMLMPQIARATHAAQESVGSLASTLERSLGALRTVKASGAEDRETTAVHAAAHRAWTHGAQAARWQALASSSTGLAIQTAFLAVLGTGGARVASGAIEPSTLVAFLLFLFYLTAPVAQLIDAFTQYHTGSAAIARITQAQQLEIEPAPDPAARRPHTIPHPARVTFQDVIFAYRDGPPQVHRGVSFTVPGPGLTALVGPSGAGKTTVFALIERFYNPTSGRILIDGKDIRRWPLDQLRASIGYVEQDAPVLAGTLRDNLLLAAPHTPDHAIHQALRRTHLDTLIDRLPQGLDTPVGHCGSHLSGGERQRVAIARAFLRQPRLLLLDEATAHLDAANEAVLHDIIAEVARHTTVLVIAHRLSTVTMADHILVMEAGRVRAAGTHHELIASDPLYARLAATQFPHHSGAGQDHIARPAARSQLLID